ncbi:MAG: methyltransferase type 11 [Frankia sp.]
MVPDAIRIGRLALPVTTIVLGALAGVFACRPRRRRSAGARAPRPIEAEASARLAVTQQTLDETTARLHAVTEQLGETRARLAEARAEVLRLSGRAQAITDRAEAEMGRMESAAITALESAAASNRQDVAGLRQRLATAEDAARVLRAELDTERRRSEQLQSALTNRDTARDPREHRA